MTRSMSPITDRLAGLGSDLWDVHFESRRRLALGDDIIELTIGEPDVPVPDSLLDVAERAMRSGRTGYSAGRGEESMLEAVSLRYGERSGRTITPESVFAFPGVQAGLSFSLLCLVTAGDDVLVPVPCYATYEGAVRASGANFVPIRTTYENGFHLTAKQLEQSLTPNSRVLLLNSPNNPTGAVLTNDELFAIGEVCARHDLWILCDEVYEQLVYPPAIFASMFDISDFSDRTIVLGSLSKSHAAPGFRAGWCVGPESFIRTLQPVGEIFLFGGQPFIADMTTHALTHPDDCAARMGANYRRRADIVTNALSNSNLTPLVPEAGMFLLVDISAMDYSSSKEFALALLASENVAVMPGDSFGGGAERFIRLSLTVDDALIEEAMNRLIRFVGGAPNG